MSGPGSHGALVEELSWLDERLVHCLLRQRGRGKSTVGDAVGGALIEEGEAEGLLRALVSAHRSDTPPARRRAEPPRRSALSELERTRDVFGLRAEERDILLVALCVEIDERYARAIAFLNDHFKMNRPTVGLAVDIVCGDDEIERANLMRSFSPQSPLLRWGLMRLEGEGPLAARSLAVPADLWPRLVGFEAEPVFPLADASGPRLADLVLPASVLDRARAVLTLARGSSAPSTIAVTGRSGVGREALAHALCLELDARSLRVTSSRLTGPNGAVCVAREALYHAAIPLLLDVDAVPAERLEEVLRAVAGPVICTGDERSLGKIVALTSRPVFEVARPRPADSEHPLLWARLLPGATQVDFAALAQRFPLGPGRIEAAARLCTSDSPENGNTSELTTADLELACRRLAGIEVGTLAQKMASSYTRDDVIVPSDVRRELDLITAWWRHGRRIFAAQEIGGKLRASAGLCCLFHGPPGTGKTMAAQAVAHDAGFEIYRIDLAQIVNKYIGETEKNLSRVFDATEDTNCVLFFDEADSLFGKRSEVKDAHDRYANIETGYLLQRIETFRGLLILATNQRKNLDDAFLRRLQIVAEFPIPGVSERRLIWNQLLPLADQRSPDVDIELLATRFAVAGGSIKNAIFSGLLLAAEADSLLTMQHLMMGVWRELKKSGRVVDMNTFGPFQKAVERFAVGETLESRRKDSSNAAPAERLTPTPPT